MSRLLVVDDQESVAYSAAVLLRRAGYEVDVCGDGQRALGMAKRNHYAVVLSDMRMEKMSGIDLLKQIRTHARGTDVIIMTAFSSIETAVEATKQGAADYICKPFQADDLLDKIKRVVEQQELQPAPAPEDSLSQRSPTQLLGESTVMREIALRAETVAQAECTVLITGETGTGKSLLAYQIHALSPRAKGPFIAVNCANLSDQLLESELFGTVKGAFTGAEVSRAGLCEAANQGTLFLDEIGAASLTVQSKLLTLLEDKHIRRLGDTRSFPVDIRIIAATNADLKQLIRDHELREDLYYRLNVVSIHLPALRERQDDIAMLAEHFLKLFARKYNKCARSFLPEAMQLLMAYEFPGNIRELENIVERAIIAGSAEGLGSEELRLGMSELASDGTENERARLLRIIVENKYNLRKAASQLGLSRTTLYRKLHRYGIHAR
jgi:DNA-binding NtrC family response regulator